MCNSTIYRSRNPAGVSCDQSVTKILKIKQLLISDFCKHTFFQQKHFHKITYYVVLLINYLLELSLITYQATLKIQLIRIRPPKITVLKVHPPGLLNPQCHIIRTLLQQLIRAKKPQLTTHQTLQQHLIRQLWKARTRTLQQAIPAKMSQGAKSPSNPDSNRASTQQPATWVLDNVCNNLITSNNSGFSNYLAN